MTISEGFDGNSVQVYKTVYNEFCPDGVHSKTYTITHICQKAACHQQTNMGLPAGFTTAAVVCEKCGSEGPRTEIPTFPADSIPTYSQQGYVVNTQ